MRKVSLLVSAGALLLISGCSGKSRNSSALPVVQASSAPANPSPANEPVAALPTVSVGSNHASWHVANVKDAFGGAIALKQTSLDGKFDLVVVMKGTHAFLSFAGHGHWESVHHRAAQGKLVNLRLRFEDGQERAIAWDELGFGTANIYSVVWAYPTRMDSSVGPTNGSNSDSIGGDELLIQEMTKHTAMVLEVAPGVTTQFAIAGLTREMAKARASKTEPILVATQPEAQ